MIGSESAEAGDVACLLSQPERSGSSLRLTIDGNDVTTGRMPSYRERFDTTAASPKYRLNYRSIGLARPDNHPLPRRPLGRRQRSTRLADRLRCVPVMFARRCSFCQGLGVYCLFGRWRVDGIDAASRANQAGTSVGSASRSYVTHRRGLAERNRRRCVARSTCCRHCRHCRRTGLGCEMVIRVPHVLPPHQLNSSLSMLMVCFSRPRTSIVMEVARQRAHVHTLQGAAFEQHECGHNSKAGTRSPRSDKLCSRRQMFRSKALNDREFQRPDYPLDSPRCFPLPKPQHLVCREFADRTY